jgi:hypothetical protein
MAEHYRVFRVEDDGLVFTGTYAGAAPKEASKQAADDDRVPAGEHVTRRTSAGTPACRIKNREERFTDEAHQLNTQEELSGVP